MAWFQHKLTNFVEKLAKTLDRCLTKHLSLPGFQCSAPITPENYFIQLPTSFFSEFFPSSACKINWKSMSEGATVLNNTLKYFNVHQTSFPVCSHKETACEDKSCKSTQGELHWSHCSPDTEPWCWCLFLGKLLWVSLCRQWEGQAAHSEGRQHGSLVVAAPLHSMSTSSARRGPEDHLVQHSSCLPCWNNHLAPQEWGALVYVTSNPKDLQGKSGVQALNCSTANGISYRERTGE